MTRTVALSALVLATALSAAAQTVPDTTTRDLGAVTVTATRTAKEIVDVAMPLTVVTSDEIAARGAVRLSDVLEDVPGLFLTDDFGTGLSVQGFSPDYTLILLDGEPIVGRTGGTLDLDRLTVAGVERVEVVRGPSSSLYGSEALAGVVNLVTSLPRPGTTEGGVRLRAGSYGATDGVVEAGVGRDTWAARAVLNRNGSAGYDLTPDDFGQTVPEFADVTADLRARARFGRSTLRLNGRIAAQEQRGGFAALGTRGELAEVDDDATRTDGSVHAEFATPIGRRLNLRSTLYGAGYETETTFTERETDVVTYQDSYDQRLAKAELQLDGLWSARHRSTVGAGGQRERLAGERYGEAADGLDARPSAVQAWAFAQHEWLPSRLVEVNASARFDAHEDYAARLTPRLSLLVRPAETLRLRASVGSGFKAPAFRQLYLAFTNAAAGYSVFGATRLADGYQTLLEGGQIAQTFLDPTTLGAIEAESSVAVNVGLSGEPARWLTVEANAYLNEVRDLIETQPIALKTNGQQVFGYFNLDRIYTRGVDLSATARPFAGLELQAGYGFLQARDREVVDALNAGTVFGRDPDGSERQLGLSDYGGLFGRSPHSLTARAELRRDDTAVSARTRWRSRYGFRDLDGNGVANRDDEFVRGFAVVDLTASHSWALPGARLAGTRLTAQAGLDNLFDVTRPTLVPSMPGRTAFVALGVTF